MRRLVFILIAVVSFCGCQLNAVSDTLVGEWVENYQVASENVVFTLSFVEEKSSRTFTWIEKQGDVEKTRRTGQYTVYLNGTVTEKDSRAVVVLDFEATADEEKKSVAFIFSFSKQDGKVFLNLKPVDETENIYVLERKNS